MALSNATYSEAAVPGELPSGAYLNNSNSSFINRSAVSWSAIFAGAAAAAVLSLILILLGAGLGLSSVSPWANKGVSAGALGISTIIWITVTQIMASGMGGYLAGRLRTRWSGVHADEVYFRDTAHGFLAWTVATLATVTLLTSAVSGIVSGAANLAGGIAGGVASTTAVAGAASSQTSQADNLADQVTGQFDYFIDSLFRKDSSVATASSTDTQSVNNSSEKNIPAVEVTRIFVNSIDTKTLPAADVTYVGQLIANNTGLTQPEAEKRVTDAFNTIQKKKADAELAAKQAAEKARKATIYATLWLFVSLLIGAFSASLAATWGGRCRDADFVNQPNTY